jgi:hypothetical protein
VAAGGKGTERQRKGFRGCVELSVLIHVLYVIYEETFLKYIIYVKVFIKIYNSHVYLVKSLS